MAPDTFEAFTNRRFHAFEYAVRVKKFSTEITAMAQKTSSSIDEISRSSQAAVASLTEALKHGGIRNHLKRN